MIPLTVSNGAARWQLPLPFDQGLIGVAFFNQALALDPGAILLGVILSNGAGVIGSK